MEQTASMADTQNMNAAHSRGWLERLAIRRKQRVAAGLRERIADLQAREEVWRLTVTAATETNAYFVDKWADYKARLAAAQERLRSLGV